MGQINLSIPQVGLPNSTEDPKIASDFNTIQTWANGNVDSTNVSATLAQSAIVNQAGQTVKGVSVNAGPGTRTNTAYGNLSDAADSVSVVLSTNGLIAVWFQATWQESVAGQALAAIFIGSNNLRAASTSGGPTSTQQTGTSGAAANVNEALSSAPFGLQGQATRSGGAYGGNSTTGQIVGLNNGTSVNGSGPCYIFAAAGTYTVSVQYKASSGTVTASNRTLWVEAISFS